MKRTKILLLVIALIGIAGGTLAFNAKFGQRFCTVTPVAGACVDEEGEDLACDNTILTSQKTTTNTSIAQKCIYVLQTGETCANKNCTTLARPTSETP